MAKNTPQITRDQSLDAKPMAVEISERKELANGDQRVSVRIKTAGFRKWLLRMPAYIKRDYELDAYGVELLELCDGQKSVRHIIKRFAKSHNLDAHEAERAVLAFLKTLISKGLVTIFIDKK